MPRRAITCSYCGEKGARVRRIIQSFGRGADKYLVRNIPTLSCSSCGVESLSSTTLHELERIKLHHRALVVRRKVAIADYPARPRRRAS